jgi:tetratricopeptide (TPR) repeat protein
MKKREQPLKKNNIVLFPDIDKRLMEKGLEFLEQKKFLEAIEFLTEAKKYNPDHEEIYIGLVLSYFESGNLHEAKKLAKEMLQTGVGDYFQIVDMYIMILVQQHQYQEIISVIEALLEEKEVPGDKLEHFLRMLQFSKNMAEKSPMEPESYYGEQHDHDLELDLFAIVDPSEQVHMAGRLANSNVRNYIDEVSEYLGWDSGDPFFKTMLLNVLKEQDIDKEIMVKKFGRSQHVIPNQLFDVHSHPDFLAISDYVASVLENEDPVLLESIQKLMERYFFLFYPFKTEVQERETWAAAFHFVASQYFGQEETLDQIAKFYLSEGNNVERAIELIARIEEISPR